jgi:hypothetical protein
MLALLLLNKPETTLMIFAEISKHRPQDRYAARGGGVIRKPKLFG